MLHNRQDCIVLWPQRLLTPQVFKTTYIEPCMYSDNKLYLFELQSF